MNKEEILNKYINLIDKGYCSDCNELNCIDNFPHSKITHAIRELQQENKQLQKELEEYKNPIKYFKYANKNVVEENKKLNDNWNKLKKLFYQKYYNGERIDTKDILDKMQELEQGSDK